LLVIDSFPLFEIIALTVPIVGSRFIPIGSTDLSPFPDVFVYGFDGGIGGVPSFSTVSVRARRTRLVQILERVARARLEVLGGQQQECVAARVERAEQVDPGAGQLELHPALAAGEVVRRDVVDADAARPHELEHDWCAHLDLVAAGCDRRHVLAEVVEDREGAVHRIDDVQRRHRRRGIRVTRAREAR